MKLSLVTGVLIFNDREEVLLCLKPAGVGPYPNMYLTPGGHLELGELANDAAAREVLEETGVTIKNLLPLIFDEFVTTNYKGEMTHYIALIYTAEFVTGELNPQSNDDDHMREIRWVNKLQITQLSLSPPLLKALKILKYI